MGKKKDKPTILIIEDDAVQRELLNEFLSDLGFSLLFAKDGLDGLEKIKKSRYDLVIADIRLPYVSGIGLIKCLRKEHPNIPVICVTAYGEYPKEIALEESPDILIEKPYNLDILIKNIKKLLELQ
ncbi:hypothetical protein JCM13304A_02410 [Desulfothermus okinawensis JCM 13304]